MSEPPQVWTRDASASGPPPRIARLVLVDRFGTPLGALPPIPVATPWWQDAAAVVTAVRDRFGIDVVVLRLLATELGAPQGGGVTYLAEVASPPPRELEPWDGTLDDDPLRMPWARPGGPDEDLAWADAALRSRGLERRAPAAQERTWNLSSLWRLALTDGTAWLKHVPPFFGHEGALLERLAAWPVPRLLAHDGARIVMPDIPGDDQYDASGAVLARMISLLVDLQATWSERVDELLGLGLPDWRGPALTARIRDVVDRTADELRPDDRDVLAAFIADLPARFAAIAECGLRDSLVHGDFHSGNVRGTDDQVVLLDWGDSGVGHPLLDQPAFFEPLAPGRREPFRERWSELWRAAIPRAEPERAARLLGPIAAARQAVIYRGFLDRIEPSERVYHRSDPATWLGRTADRLRAEGSEP